ncbi:Hint domain-containing protein [Nioella sp. MMSF_3534]|uniref:Hint domain-containing protein n=1 Tax=Nioella sp. MMSF_3534 TaxID=3046720 RepID=UPI00273E2E97|nr:Hint domain-containing protein [Nioella sp. MMSF_3534]
MPVSVGDIYFTSLITDPDGSNADSFSFVTTTNIAAGETITFHQPEALGDGFFTYTVGVGGLSALDQVVIILPNNSSATVQSDPSGGSISGFTGTISITSSDNLIAGSGGQVIAAISNGGLWNQTLTNLSVTTDTLTVTGLSDSALNTFIANNPTLASPAVEDLDNFTNVRDNMMFTGGDITLHGDDHNYWTGTNDPVSHTNPDVNGTTYATQAANVTCFLAGSLISTIDGEKPVESLSIGDLIVSQNGSCTPVKWIGRQTVSTRFGPAERLMPVRFAAGSLGEGLPHTDLTVTADHGMLVGGVICHAGALVNGTTITRVPLAEMGESYTVYHIETEEHEIILANGAPAETFIDNVSRRVFDNYAEFEALYGDVPEMEELPYPRAMSARQVPGWVIRAIAGAKVA